jgi:hypothetical protein
MISRKDFPTVKHLLHKLAVNHPKMTMADFASDLYGDDRLSSKVKNIYGKLNPEDDRSHFKENDFPRMIQTLNKYAPKDKLDTHGGCAIVHYLAGCAGMVATRVDTDGNPAPPGKGGGVPGDFAALSDCMKALMDYLAQIMDLIHSRDLNSEKALSLMNSNSYKVKAALLKMEQVMGPINDGQ